MNYVKITADRFDDVIQYLRYTFFVDEPLNKAVELSKPGEKHAESEKYALKTMAEGLSIAAVSDDNKIAGVALNGINRNTENRKLDIMQQLSDENFKKIVKLLYTVNAGVNLFKELDVDEIFEIRILSVNPEFRGQGIAKYLLQKSEEMARDNAFKVLKADGTGYFSQRVHASAGFEKRYELRYDEYVDENQVPVFSVEPPHESIQILYKCLDVDDDEHVTSF